LFFIEVATRRVHPAGCTAHPDEVTQRARHVSCGGVPAGSSESIL
jgi:hypothetical protein